jgi:hypothetical protein
MRQPEQQERWDGEDHVSNDDSGDGAQHEVCSMPEVWILRKPCRRYAAHRYDGNRCGTAKAVRFQT